MSIFNECKKYDALPFFGFPLKITLLKQYRKEPKIYYKFYFPEGYEPNENQIKRVSKRLLKAIGKAIIQETENSFTIEINTEKLTYYIYQIALKNS